MQYRFCVASDNGGHKFVAWWGKLPETMPIVATVRVLQWEAKLYSEFDVTEEELVGYVRDVIYMVRVTRGLIK